MTPYLCSSKTNKKFNIMKKYLAIISLLLAGVISLYGMNNHSHESKSIIVEINKSKIDWSTDIERSVDFSVIEALAYPKLGWVEVTLHNIGDATVRLINSNNQVVSSDCVQTDILTTVYLDTFSTSGTFYLEIASDAWYAKGVVSF